MEQARSKIRVITDTGWAIKKGDLLNELPAEDDLRAKAPNAPIEQFCADLRVT